MIFWLNLIPGVMSCSNVNSETMRFWKRTNKLQTCRVKHPARTTSFDQNELVMLKWETRFNLQTETDKLELSLRFFDPFLIFFSGSSDTNNDSLSLNTTHTRQPRLRYLFQIVHTQTRTAYYRVLPTLDHHV